MCERSRLVGLGLGGIACLVLQGRHTEQLSRPRDVLDALAAGEQAVVAGAGEAAGGGGGEEPAGGFPFDQPHPPESVVPLLSGILPPPAPAVLVSHRPIAPLCFPPL